MKKLILAILVLPLLMSCSSDSINTTRNIEVVEKYVQAVENLDYKTMDSLLADNYYGFGPSYGDSIGKKQAVKNWKYNIEHLYKSIHYNKSRNASITIKSGDNQGNWVSNWGELSIVYKNNKHVTLWANSIYEIKNGKIIKSYTFYDEADALRQLGYVFIDPNDL